MKTRKSWREKMDNPRLRQTGRRTAKNAEEARQGYPAVARPSRRRNTHPQGSRWKCHDRWTDARRTRAKYDADVACPLLTGIFVRIAAEAAEEEAAAGKTRITPYWRVLKDDGSLNPKFPGGVERQEERLRDEGHHIDSPARGKRPPRVLLEGTTGSVRAVG